MEEIGSARQLPLVVIVGPTASGKSALAVRVAEQYNGEVICADSRTIYKHMDIGTAKPDAEDRARVPHWGIDLVNPGDRFTAADFKVYALEKISEIRQRGKVPIMVGGTGLYIDGVILDYQFGGDRNKHLRTRLELQSIDELQSYCHANNIQLPENSMNKRYLVRAIERESVSIKRDTVLIDDTIVVGISTDKDILAQRIRTRIEQMLSNGVVEEAISLGKKYGWNSEAMTGNIYRLIAELTDRGTRLMSPEGVDIIATKDIQLAKKQMTWFRRNNFIKWGTTEELFVYIENALHN